MGLYFGCRSSLGRSRAGTPAPTDPDPKRFKLLSVELSHNQAYTVAVVSYPNCTTFEGDKILVFAGDVREKVRAATELDPHFTDRALSPIARFAPTWEGHRALTKLLVC